VETLLMLSLASVGACGEDAEVYFTEAYVSTYTEVRDCRRSGDHNLRFIKVLVEPAALEPYQGRLLPFPEGAVVLKEEYAFDDPTCAGEPIQWTAMRKRSASSNQLGWDWQRVDPDFSVVEENKPSCFGCHEPCTGAPPGSVGYDYTCTDP
jgi:hypothetical protein